VGELAGRRRRRIDMVEKGERMVGMHRSKKMNGKR
jgi:hypothetical protein